MKLTKILLAATLATALVACSGKETLIKDYETACSKGQIVKAANLAQKIEDKYGEKLTTDDMQRIASAALKLETKSIEDAAKMLEGASNMFDLFGSLDGEDEE